MTDAEITALVFLRHNPVPAELAIVFGAANEADLVRRTSRGVELYRAGLVPKLLLTGGGVLARESPEAQQMGALAQSAGVLECDLLVEDRSENTFENLAFSVALLQERSLLDHLTTVLLVSSEWHMGRVLLTAKRYFQSQVSLVCCPTLEGCSRENWTASAACRRVVRAEAALCHTFLSAGAI